MWGKPTFFDRAKSIEKNIEKGKYWHSQLRKAFSIGKNLLRKILEKDKYWHNQLRTASLIDPLKTNRDDTHMTSTLGGGWGKAKMRYYRT